MTAFLPFSGEIASLKVNLQLGAVAAIHRNNKLKQGAYLRWGLTEYLLNLKSTNCVDCTLDGAFS
jgi:hypothetical protein